jgi:hypothetical protein
MRRVIGTPRPEFLKIGDDVTIGARVMLIAHFREIREVTIVKTWALV